MSDELHENSELEFVDKAAVVAVFLLAGVFLWQFLGNGNVTDIDNLSNQTTAKTDEAEPQTYYKSKSQPLETENSIKGSSAIKTADSAIIPEKELSKTEVVKAPVTAISPVETPVEEVRQVAKPIEEVKKIISPTIKPVTSDLTQGILKLSGNGEPNSFLQLMLNGERIKKIDIDKSGAWIYQTVLEPGDYSVQVLPAELNEQMSAESAVTKISIPELQSSVPESTTKLEAEKEALTNEVENLAVQIEKHRAELEAATQRTQEPAEDKPAQIPSDKNGVNEKLYKVKSGDTINNLSRRFKVSRSQLLQLNKISDKDVIEVDQMLIIPK
jgi:LysM repeat protein